MFVSKSKPLSHFLENRVRMKSRFLSNILGSLLATRASCESHRLWHNTRGEGWLLGRKRVGGLGRCAISVKLQLTGQRRGGCATIHICARFKLFRASMKILNWISDTTKFATVRVQARVSRFEQTLENKLKFLEDDFQEWIPSDLPYIMYLMSADNILLKKSLFCINFVRIWWSLPSLPSCLQLNWPADWKPPVTTYDCNNTCKSWSNLIATTTALCQSL